MYRKEYMKEYRKNNRDILNAQRRKYYAKHRDKVLEDNRRWLENNKEKVLENRKEYYKKNKEKIYTQQTEYRHTHAKEFSKMVSACKRRKYEQLRSQGIKNAWAVINYKAEPKYEEVR